MMLSGSAIVALVTVLANLCAGQLSICQYAKVTVSGNITVFPKSNKQILDAVPVNSSVVSFRSPLPSENISSSEECILQVKGAGIIQIDVTAFDLGGRDPCSPDEEYLSIDFYQFYYFGLSLSVNGVPSNRGYVDSVRWCGRSYSTRLETRQMMILRYSGGPESKRGSGFTIRLSQVGLFTCGGGQAQRVGHQPMYVYSPGYPAPYDNNINCNWNLISENQGPLQLESLRFSLEPEATCRYDFLTINRETYCGDQRVRVRSKHDDLEISLHTDHTDQLDGFVLKVVEVAEDIGSCGQHVITSTAPTTLQVPTLNERHVFSMNCWWVVDAGSVDRVVLLENTRFHTTASCTEFELVIYDGNNTQSPNILSSCAPVEMFQTVRSSSQYLYIDIYMYVTSAIDTTIDVIYTVTSHQRDAVPRVLYAGFSDSFIWLDLALRNDLGLLVRGNEEDAGNYSTCLQLSLKQSPSRASSLNIKDYFYIFSGWNSSFAELGGACGRSTSEVLISRGSKVYIVFRQSLPTSAEQVWLTYRLRKYQEYCKPEVIHLQSSSNIVRSLRSDMSYNSVTDTVVELSGSYPNNAYCRYLIEPENSATFTRAVVTQSSLWGTSCHDNVTAYDYPKGTGYQSMLLQWCHAERPVVMSSKGSRLLLEFVSDDAYTSTGFNISYSSVSLVDECPSMVVVMAEESPQNLTSPNYPHNYPNGVDCRWRLQAKSGVVKLTVVTLSIVQETTSCSLADYLVIYDGWDRSGRILADLCGSRTDHLQLTSTGTYMMVHFHSNHGNTASGFQLQYQSTEDNDVVHCNRRVFVTTNEDSEVITPYFPNAYPGNTDCYWLVEALLTHVVMMEVIKLDLPCDSPVILYDGPSESSLKIASLCGSHYQRQYVTTQKSLYIRFRSTSNSGYQGFKFRLRSWRSDGACLGKVAHLMAYTTQRRITSPGYPAVYPPNSDCRWRIESAHKNMSVRIVIEDAEMQSSPECDLDRLSVYDGYGPGSRLLGKYCNNHVESFWSSETYLYLHFVSDGSIGYKGFSLLYQAVPEKAPSTPQPGVSDEGNRTGAIIGGVMGGVAFLIIGITLFLCYLGRCQRPQPGPDTPDSSLRRQREGSTVFVMNPVIVNHMAPPPPYPGLTNSSYVPDDQPPAYPAIPSTATAVPPPVHLDAPPSYSEAMLETNPPSAGLPREEEEGRRSQFGEGQRSDDLGPPRESGYGHGGDGDDGSDYQRVSAATSHMPLTSRSSGEDEYDSVFPAYSGAPLSTESARTQVAHPQQPLNVSSSVTGRQSHPPPGPHMLPLSTDSAEQQRAPPTPAQRYQSQSSSSQHGQPQSAQAAQRRSQASAQPRRHARRPDRSSQNSSSPGQVAPSASKQARNSSTPQGRAPPPPVQRPRTSAPSYGPPSGEQQRLEASSSTASSQQRHFLGEPSVEEPQDDAAVRQDLQSQMSGEASEMDLDPSYHEGAIRLNSIDSVGTAV